MTSCQLLVVFYTSGCSPWARVVMLTSANSPQSANPSCVCSSIYLHGQTKLNSILLTKEWPYLILIDRSELKRMAAICNCRSLIHAGGKLSKTFMAPFGHLTVEMASQCPQCMNSCFCISKANVWPNAMFWNPFSCGSLFTSSCWPAFTRLSFNHFPLLSVLCLPFPFLATGFQY